MNPVEESVSQFYRAWQTMIHTVPGASTAGAGALCAAVGNLPLFVLNALFLNKPVDSTGLETALAATSQCLAGCEYPYMVCVCDSWIPQDAPELLAASGLHAAFGFMGMVTDSLEAPVRPAPPELELRSGLNPDTMNALMDVNAQAYGYPIELGRASIRPGLLETDSYCVAGYVDGQPVSVTATFAVDGRLYVGWVATLPEARGKGYAEAVMRRSLADASAATGLTRTVLHASDAGYPIYKRMGYQDTVRFTAYVHGLDH